MQPQLTFNQQLDEIKIPDSESSIPEDVIENGLGIGLSLYTISCMGLGIYVASMYTTSIILTLIGGVAGGILFANLFGLTILGFIAFCFWIYTVFS